MMQTTHYKSWRTAIIVLLHPSNTSFSFSKTDTFFLMFLKFNLHLWEYFINFLFHKFQTMPTRFLLSTNYLSLSSTSFAPLLSKLLLVNKGCMSNEAIYKLVPLLRILFENENKSLTVYSLMVKSLSIGTKYFAKLYK